VSYSNSENEIIETNVGFSAFQLRSVEALDALANCCDHIQHHPDIQLLFRYLTTASATIEVGWIGRLSGIATWQALRHGDYNDQQRSSDSVASNIPRAAGAPDEDFRTQMDSTSNAPCVYRHDHEVRSELDAQRDASSQYSGRGNGDAERRRKKAKRELGAHPSPLLFPRRFRLISYVVDSLVAGAGFELATFDL
jgi:hypothetical protein